MPLGADAKTANLEKSLTAWIQAKLVTLAGLTVFYGMAPIATVPDEWVHVDYVWDLRADSGRQVGATQLGHRAHSLLQVSLCKKRTSITNIYALAVLYDKVVPYFQVGQTIAIRDYDTGGTPEVGSFIVGNRSIADVDDGLASGVIVRALSIPLTHIGLYTLV